MSLFYLSAAFDTYNHDILLSRHESQFHITGTALTWFRSYLDSRTQRVKIDDSLSDPIYLEHTLNMIGQLLRLLQVLYCTTVRR